MKLLKGFFRKPETGPGEKYKADEGDIFTLSRRLGCSEFEIFRISAEKCNIAMSRVIADFRTYILFSEVPFYVRAWVRSMRATVLT
jgi:hypothetical protein